MWDFHLLVLQTNAQKVADVLCRRPGARYQHGPSRPAVRASTAVRDSFYRAMEAACLDARQVGRFGLPIHSFAVIEGSFTYRLIHFLLGLAGDLKATLIVLFSFGDYNIGSGRKGPQQTRRKNRNHHSLLQT